MLLSKRNKNQSVGKANRLLISINVLGSAGPIRFVVCEDELVAAIIDTALKSYAREGSLPILGSDLTTSSSTAPMQNQMVIGYPKFDFTFVSCFSLL